MGGPGVAGEAGAGDEAVCGDENRSRAFCNSRSRLLRLIWSQRDKVTVWKPITHSPGVFALLHTVLAAGLVPLDDDARRDLRSLHKVVEREVLDAATGPVRWRGRGRPG